MQSMIQIAIGVGYDDQINVSTCICCAYLDVAAVWDFRGGELGPSTIRVSEGLARGTHGIGVALYVHKRMHTTPCTLTVSQ
jgi:hypothetical protein